MARITRSVPAAAALLALAAAGCDRPRADGVGAAQLALDLAPGVTLATVAYEIDDAFGHLKSGAVDVSQATTLTGVIGKIPAGTGYTLTVTSTATDGTTTCAGTAMFAVTAGTTTPVPVHLTCHLQPRTGSIALGGRFNVCPRIDGVSANPAEVRVGGVSHLGAIGVDPDGAPAPLQYAWTVTAGGTLDAAAAPNPNLTCVAAAAVTVTVTVSDGDTTPGCAATQSFTVTCD